MLNHSEYQSSQTAIYPDPAQADWCVGHASSRWDVSFAGRLIAELKRWFRRPEPAPGHAVPSGNPSPESKLPMPQQPAVPLPLIGPLNNPALFTQPQPWVRKAA